MEIVSNVITEILFGIFRKIHSFFKKEEKPLHFSEFEREGEGKTEIANISSIVGCIITLAIIAAITILILNLDTVKLFILAVFALFSILIGVMCKD